MLRFEKQRFTVYRVLARYKQDFEATSLLPETPVALTGLKREPRFPELLTFLGYREEMELRRRSQLWPPGVRDRLHRAFAPSSSPAAPAEADILRVKE